MEPQNISRSPAAVIAAANPSSAAAAETSDGIVYWVATQADPAAPVLGPQNALNAPGAIRPLRAARVDTAEMVAIIDLVQAHLGGDTALRLTPNMYQELAWQQANSFVTPEASVRLATQVPHPLNTEVKRSLARLACFHHLLRGDDAAYSAFIASQPQQIALTRQSFDKLHAIVSAQTPAARQVIEASSLLKMTQKAKAAATEYLAPSPDSEKFLTQVTANCPHVLPMWDTLSPSARALLPWAYLPNTHARHMLYTEGGDNMFEQMRAEIRAGTLTDERFGAWLGRWLVDIAGFHGHCPGSGSVYLTEGVAQAVFILVDNLEGLRENPERNVLQAYLAARGEVLNTQESNYLSHLVCMLHIYSAEEASAYKSAFAAWPASRQAQAEKDYRATCQARRETPTYEPAMLGGLKQLGCSASEILDLHAAISAAAQRSYQTAQQEGIVASTTPLSFAALAKGEMLELLVASWRKHGDIPGLQIDAQGLCTVSP